MYSPDAYRELIALFRQQGYRFAGIGDPIDEAGGKLAYLRHDIDYSPAWAADFARIDAELGVRAMFCFQLRSPLYNLASRQCRAAVDAVLAAGHRVGLHFTILDAAGVSEAELARAIAADLAAARALVPAIAPVFSWHNPSLVPGLIERLLDFEVPGLVNLYGRRWVRDTRYFSDSNWRYSIAKWQEIARAGHARVQLLFHPFQWMARGRDMRDVLARTYVQLISEAEAEFSTNHVYRQMHPDGLPPQAQQAIERLVLPDET
jgi:hypothetical protein